MARKTKNEMVTENDHGTHRGTRNGAPAVETANTRVDTIGPFRKSNIAVSLANVNLPIGAVDTDAPTQYRAHSSGNILGVTYDFNALVTAGGASAATIQPTIAPAGVAANVAAATTGSVVVASAASGNPQGGIVDLVETKFNKGDALGVQLSTSGTFAPTTADLDVYLIVRWDPSPGVPA